MRIGLISDLHGNAAGTAAALSLLDDCDRVLCAGDVFNLYGGDPRVVDLLRERDVGAVAGNHDWMYARESRRTSTWERVQGYLSALPAQRTWTVGGQSIRLVHGAPWDVTPEVSTYLFEHMHADPRLDGLTGLLVVGHTHVPYVKQADGDLCIVSPGSAGVQDSSGLFHAAVVDLHRMQVERLDFVAAKGRADLVHAHVTDLRVESGCRGRADSSGVRR